VLLPKSTMWRRLFTITTTFLVAFVSLVGLAVIAVHWHREHPKSNMPIPAAEPADSTAPWPARSVGPVPAPASLPPFISSTSHDGHYFVDQSGKPFYVRGDSPWSLPVDLTPADAELYIANRKTYGVNAMIMSALGAVANGGPHDDGRTVDGIRPFIDRDVTLLEPRYWDRLHYYVTLARDAGITVLLYPIDSWVIGHSFRPKNLEQCGQYGQSVAARFSDLPNIVWMSGGDYIPNTDDPAAGSDADRCINKMMGGIRDAGDNRLFSIQLVASNSTDNPYWAPRVDWNFVYTYPPSFTQLRRAYELSPARPAIMGESNYEGENNQPDTPPTTMESLRRQAWWTITSGGTGDFYGSDDWEFLPGWQDRLDSPGLAQARSTWSLLEAIQWWRLVPDTDQRLITSGAGDCSPGNVDVLDRDCVTGAVSADGDLAVVFVPTSREFTLNTTRLKPGITFEWVDPVSGTRLPTSKETSYTTPGVNSAGATDWLLIAHSK
jgi:hypothetical protein